MYLSDVSSIKLLSFDIDDTLLPSHHHSDAFYQFWNRLEFKSRPLLCYNTGRLKDDTLRLINQKILPKPDYLICGVGTLIYDIGQATVLKKFAQVLEAGWDLDKVSQLMLSSGYDIRRQPDHFQNPYKSSWFFNDAKSSEIEAIRNLLTQNGIDANVIYSSARHLDILPKWANKGNSLEWLLHFLGIEANEAIVAGNSGNDSAMFKVDGIKGIVVGNAQPELVEETRDLDVYCTGKLYQAAISDGLLHFGMQFHIAEEAPVQEEINLELVNLMETSEIVGINKKQLTTIRKGYEMALEVIDKNITPIGFSACSLDDNVSVGRDSNYRSVWARDGSISITGTIPLIENERIADCQRSTLETILEHTTEHGLVPSNVSIDTREPDYSGTGGICSADSGLWLIIAFHDFIKGSGDLEFLRTYIDKLAAIMVWLTAQDGNNNALLEIPEAGDWMNLKGRHYNVLYDEVLWYHANVCMARLYEILGEDNKTGRCLTWSQVIKNTVIRKFWIDPYTVSGANGRTDSGSPGNGNAQYLISHTTPFGFSRRCDIYGNILAHLYNIVDKQKAIATFRFIWGFGGNEPFPMKNIYPARLTEEPDLGSIDGGGLLNLPHHYHNGGIWPFIGGAWVRNIHKLGLRELALQELYKLSKLNKLGILNKWEFNEWCHGGTGRPMGKAYQAWSASEYIHACYDLGVVD